MKKRLAVISVMIIAHSLSYAHAGVDEYKAAAAGFCDKIKMCINEEMAKEMGGNVPPQMQKMVDGMASQMCAQYVPQMFEEKFTQHEDIVDKGTQCLTEMQDKPCSDFENEKIPASCEEMQSMAKAAGLVD